MQKLEQISSDVDHLFDQDISPLLDKTEAAIDAAIDEVNKDANATIDEVDNDINETINHIEHSIVASATCVIYATKSHAHGPRVESQSVRAERTSVCASDAAAAARARRVCA